MKRKTLFVIILILAVAVLASFLVAGFVRRHLLIDAAWDGNVRKVQAILRSRPHLAGAKGISGYAPLHAAADHGHVPILEMLLEAGANPNVRDRKSRTPLYYAAQNGDLNALDVLIDGGADVGLFDDHGVTPLHLAVQSGSPELVSRLITMGADPIAQDSQGYTPFHYMGMLKADITPEVGRVIALLKGSGSGRLLDMAGHDGKTALHLAARRRNPILAEALVLAGAAVNVRSHQGQTPLHIALSIIENTTTPLFLVKHGADLKVADKNGALPIHLAAAVGDIGVIDASLKAGVSIEARDAAGATPLFYAARNRQYDLFNGLLARGADRNARSKKGDTALHEAVGNMPEAGLTHGWLFIDAAVQAGLDINAANHSQETPLLVAARMGHWDYVQSLMDNGADAGVTDGNGRTALHLAVAGAASRAERVSSRFKEITKTLLGNHADINARDRFGRTPLHLAADAGNREMARFLIKHGADQKARDNKGRTPFETTGWRLRMSSLITAYCLLALVFAELAWVIVYERKRRRAMPKMPMWLAFLGLALLLAFILWRANPARVLKYGVVVAPAVSIILLTELIGQNIRKTSERKARLFRRALIASGIVVWIGACVFYFIKFKTEPPFWLTLGFGNGLIIGGGSAGKDPRDSGGWKPPAWREPSEQGKGPEESSGEVR